MGLMISLFFLSAEINSFLFALLVINMLKIGFIGAGKMAEAMIKAVINSKINDKNNVYASDKNKERLGYIKKQTKINVFDDNKKVINNSDVVFLCVKPQNMDKFLDEIKDEVKEQLIVSITAGIKLKKLETFKISKKSHPCLFSHLVNYFEPIIN